jgi:hypothetical protein
MFWENSDGEPHDPTLNIVDVEVAQMPQDVR